MAQQILIIDADPVAGAVTAGLVHRIALDATVVVEATPSHGWLHAQRHPLDVLFIDPLPVSAGVRIIELCREQNVNLRVVVLTSAATPTVRRQLEPVGVDVYAAKPIASVQATSPRADRNGPASVVGNTRHSSYAHRHRP